MPFEPFTICGDPLSSSPLVLTCEHASNLVPPPLSASEADRVWLETHWGWDPGAAALTRGLVAALGATAILAEFSRLVCDPNRPPDHPTWARTELVENGQRHVVSFNADLDPVERERRRTELFEGYHGAIHSLLSRRKEAGLASALFSVHSFTPALDGTPRQMEVGVLFDREEDAAERLAQLLKERGFLVALNEPYSGRAGLMYSVDRHARAHAIPCLEIEVRQDLLDAPSNISRVASYVAHALQKLGWTPRGRPITYRALPD